MFTTLKLENPLTDSEMREFMLKNELKLNDFTGYEYHLCLFATESRKGKLEYFEPYSEAFLKAGITLEKASEFFQNHKDIMISEKTISPKSFITFYYLVYRREVPALCMNYNNFDSYNADIELVFECQNYYSPQTIHLSLHNYDSVMKAVEQVFSNENYLEALPFITVNSNNNHYIISFYDEHGYEKLFQFKSLADIYNNLVSVRVIGIEEN